MGYDELKFKSSLVVDEANYVMLNESACNHFRQRYTQLRKLVMRYPSVSTNSYCNDANGNDITVLPMSHKSN